MEVLGEGSARILIGVRTAPLDWCSAARPLTPHIWPCIVTIVMGRKKISTTVYITPEQNDLLKQLHDKTKVPVAEFIRQGIDLVLDREKRNLPGQMTFDVDRPLHGRDKR